MRATNYLILSFLILASCDSDSNFENTDNFLGNWELKYVIVEGDIVQFPPSRVTLSFNEDSKDLIFSGNSTCNFYGGKVNIITKESIFLSSMHTTEIACSSEILNTFERNYYNWLAKAKQYNIDGNKLVLSYENNSLNFEKIK